MIITERKGLLTRDKLPFTRRKNDFYQRLSQVFWLDKQAFRHIFIFLQENNERMNRHILLLLLLLFASLSITAQEVRTTADSLAAEQDSLVHNLQNQLQELKLQSIMMQEELERTGKNARMDSLARVNRKLRIDSLRKVTKGFPLVVEGDTLFTLYAAKGGMQPDMRVKEMLQKIEALGRRITIKKDSVVVFNGEYFSDVMAGDIVILSVTDVDALWQDTEREALATKYAEVIQKKISDMQDKYGLRQKLIGLLLAVFIIVLQVFLIKFTLKLFRKWKFRLTRWAVSRNKNAAIRDYGLLNSHRQGLMFLFIYRIARILLIALQLLISIPVLFSIFPETKTLTITILSYIWVPVKQIAASCISFLPSLFQIAIIYLCFRYLVRATKYLADEIEHERLKINGFYPDWAQPTFFILRVLLYSLMLIMIWPLLPNSDSEIFQGVSVFIGIIVSLGSTSIIGNTVAGMVMTYMRPFHIGDYIKVGDTVGEVIEKTVLVTRIRTRKNEVVTIQNSNLMGSQTSNFTVAAKNYGLIVHTKVTIGYDVPWQKIKDIMETAALETKGIKRQPKPFMMITSLDDFYVEYEINAYTQNATELPKIYSELHQNLLRRFFEEGVEIMSPHIYARRDGIDTQMPPEYLK